MARVQLIHPDGKKAVTMEEVKYTTLRACLLSCLKKRKKAAFKELLSDVDKELKKKKIKLEGKLPWNLFWVSLDLESRKALRKDRSSSPITYSLS